MKNYYVVPSATFINTIFVLLLHLILLINPVFSFTLEPIPDDSASLKSWAEKNLVSFEKRKDDITNLDPALVTAEKKVVIIKVRQDGSGQFKTVTEAIKSIPQPNTKRTIVWIGPGTYREKINIERTQPFVTLYGDPTDMPILTFDGNAIKYGTVFSATVMVFGDYFMAVNIIFENSSPKPAMSTMNGQAVALTITADKGSFYNCKFKGFQDTLCDNVGNHFFKDCYVEGTVDFVFGDGKSLYLNTELRSFGGRGAVITAHARKSESDDSGFAFVHCLISGPGDSQTYLGRAWQEKGKVVFIYTDMGTVIHPEGWSDKGNANADKSVFYGEYKCKGTGANPSGRVKYVKMLTEEEVKPFLNLNYIKAQSWLLPPPEL